MPEFTIRDEAPTSCMTCATHAGPFVDLMVAFKEFHTPDGVHAMDGSFFICVGCGKLIGLTVGMVTPEREANLVSAIRGRDTEIDRLKDAVAAAQENQVVPLADVVAELEAARGLRTREPDFQPAV